MKYQDIRKFSYKTEREVLSSKAHNFDMDDWFLSPYTCAKVRFYIELSSIFVYLLQDTKVTPNQISYTYAILGIFGGFCLASKINSIIIFGIFIIFFKVAVDGADGLLARVKYKPTDIGAVIDSWGGRVGEYGFIFGFGFYLFNFTSNIFYLYVMTAIILLKCLDLKSYTMMMAGESKSEKLIFYQQTSINKNPSLDKKNLKKTIIEVIKKLVISYNYEGKTVDFILLLILIELYCEKVIVSNYFFYLYLGRGILIFFRNIFLINKNN